MKKYFQFKSVSSKISTLAFVLFLICSKTEAFSQTGDSPTRIEGISPAKKILELTISEYEDRVHAIWISQMLGAIMGFSFEHHTASVEWVDKLPSNLTTAMVDDDWYYEMATIRAFEKYGIDMTVADLGKQWVENSCGSWGSSEQARLLMKRGIKPPQTGHPQYNRLWFSIGPQFSADVYGALAPGMPNLAAKLARTFAGINGYAEGLDGAVFVAGAVSLGFTEKDSKVIVRKAAKLIRPESPYRKCLDLVIQLAEQGKTEQEVFDAVEDRWHIEYPATNNAVPNGGIIAASIWFGQADFLKTVNLAYKAADFSDADCNAANAGAVIGAMMGMKGIPENLVKGLSDRIKGAKMGPVMLTPAVDESISGLARRTVQIGSKIIGKNGAEYSGNKIRITVEEVKTQSSELFSLSDLTKYWNKDWKLERAGFGGAGGGMGGIRGITYLDGDVLATYPRDEVRGLLLSRKLKVGNENELSLEVGVDSGRTWRLNVFINNKKITDKLIEGLGKEKNWEKINVDLSPYNGQEITIRLYQLVLNHGKEAGNAYWKNIRIK